MLWSGFLMTLALVPYVLSKPIAIQHRQEANIVERSQIQRRAAGSNTYSVVSGDTGYTIASVYSITFSTLNASNPSVNWNALQVGQNLNMPSNRVPISYTVVSGDSQSSIASKYDIYGSDLANANPSVNWASLQPGTRLRVPGYGTYTTYTVTSGDTGSVIASAYSITFNSLSAANPNVNWNNLQIGQVLTVPAGTSPSTGTLPSPASSPASSTTTTARSTTATLTTTATTTTPASTTTTTTTKPTTTTATTTTTTTTTVSITTVTTTKTTTPTSASASTSTTSSIGSASQTSSITTTSTTTTGTATRTPMSSSSTTTTSVLTSTIPTSSTSSTSSSITKTTTGTTTTNSTTTTIKTTTTSLTTKSTTQTSSSTTTTSSTTKPTTVSSTATTTTTTTSSLKSTTTTTTTTSSIGTGVPNVTPTATVTGANYVAGGNNNDGVASRADSYTFYQGDGSTAAGWPAKSQWISFTAMWNNISPYLGQSCQSIYGVPNNSAQENQYIYNAIQTVASNSGVDHRIILATIIQESSGCVRVKTTISPDGTVKNPGLMQDFNGSGSCNGNGNIQNPCPAGQIYQMIEDGTFGTSTDGGKTYNTGLVQDINSSPNCSDAQVIYRAARIYNSGSVPTSNDLGAPGATRCYASDMANRLMGWVGAKRTCTLDG